LLAGRPEEEEEGEVEEEEEGGEGRRGEGREGRRERRRRTLSGSGERILGERRNCFRLLPGERREGGRGGREVGDAGGGG